MGLSGGKRGAGSAIEKEMRRCGCGGGVFFFFKQKTAYEVKECDWSSDVCSSDLHD